MKTSKNLLVLALASAGLVVAAPAAFAQEGEGSAEVNASASGEVNASGTANANVSAPAPAAGDPGKLGVGGAITLAGLGGLEITYHMSDKLMLNGVIAFASFSPDMGDSSTLVGIAASAFYNLYDHAWADLYAGGRLGFVSGKSDANDATAFLVELPLRLEIHLHRRLSLHFETGVVFDFLSLSPPGAGDSVSVTKIGIGALGGNPLRENGGGDIFATGGFTINF